MDELPFYRRPGFRVAFWLMLLLGLYAYQILTQKTAASLLAALCNAGLLAGLLVFWMAFYAQFILPLRTLDQRRKISARLWSFVSKTHGPAVFIENGRLRAEEGELQRRQAGLVWLDTASAALTRTATSYRRVLGPGVHFLERGEYLAGWLDLHVQVQSIGPKEGDQPFRPLAENADEQSQARYREMQERRLAVCALTRDGIELVPKISVKFKLDAEPAPYGQPGSHFGFDEEAGFKAISHEGVNPSPTGEARRIAWNLIPALIAVDLWREYAAKFTLDQFFEPSQPPLPEIPQPPPLRLKKTPLRLPPARVSLITGLLRYINRRLELHLEKIETESRPAAAPAPAPPTAEAPPPREARPQTALQIIAQMMRARMTQERVPALDECGRLVEGSDGYVISEEYRKLQARGLRVLDVSLDALYLPPAVEEHAIREWNASWLSNAKAERERMERRMAFVAEDGRRTALRDYALALGKALVKGDARDPRSALLSLLERSRTEVVRDDRLRRLPGTEPLKPPPPPADTTSALTAALSRVLKETSRETQPSAGAAAPRPSVPPAHPGIDLEALDQLIKKAEANEL